MTIPELLAPAGNPEKLKIALAYGADAVYLGGKSFGLRAFSDNFTDDELRTGIKIAHDLKKKVYITVNIFPHNDDLKELPEYIRLLDELNVDGIIVADLGVFRLIRQIAPDIPLHISTQANNTNWSSVLGWQEMGAKRVVLAREISLADLAVIRAKTSLDLECFVHGAMCIAYSGRCLLSNYFTGRDANRGQCAQPCRWKYYLREEKRPGQFFPVGEDDRGTYLMNSKDLCLIDRIDKLAECGINSFKIEGRMKSIHYVATVVKVYREALDFWRQNPGQYKVKTGWRAELNKVSHREYTTGFLDPEPAELKQIYASASYIRTHDFVGLVTAYDRKTGMATVEQRNNLKLGDEVEIMQPNKPNFSQPLTEMYDQDGQAITVAPHPQQIIKMPVRLPVTELAMLRRKITNE